MIFEVVHGGTTGIIVCITNSEKETSSTVRRTSTKEAQKYLTYTEGKMVLLFKEGLPVDDDTSHQVIGSDSSISVSTIGDPVHPSRNSAIPSNEKGESYLSYLLFPLKNALGLISPSHAAGTNSLFRAISDENWDQVITICKRKPSEAAEWQNIVARFFERPINIEKVKKSSKSNEDGAPPPPPPSRPVLSRMLPLHYACMFRTNPPTSDAILQLIKAYPNALLTAEGAYGRLPLHVACHPDASPVCIHELIAHYPDGLFERDAVGRVPLHYALSNSSSIDVLEEILLQASLYDEGHTQEDGLKRLCGMSDANGWLPLHVACSTWESSSESSPNVSVQKMEILRSLVDAYPEAVDCVTNKESLPRSLLEAKFNLNSSSRTKEEIQAIFLVQSRNEIKSQIMSDGYLVGRRTTSSPARILTDLNNHVMVSRTGRLTSAPDDDTNEHSMRHIVKSTPSGTLTYDTTTTTEPNRATSTDSRKEKGSKHRGFHFSLKNFSCKHGVSQDQ